MSGKTIIVPIDFSHHSLAALEYAESFAKDSRAELLITHVVSDLPSVGGLNPAETLESLRSALSSVVPKNESVAYSHRLVDGKPGEAIVDIASEYDCEMIVMGTHGRAGFNRILMGSVAEYVVRNAPCPVLTVRVPESKDTGKGVSHGAYANAES